MTTSEIITGIVSLLMSLVALGFALASAYNISKVTNIISKYKDIDDEYFDSISECNQLLSEAIEEAMYHEADGNNAEQEDDV